MDETRILSHWYPMNEAPHSSPSSTCNASQPLVDQSLHVFVDGCFDPVSRQGGWAFVVYRDAVEVASDFGKVPDTSNNATEAIALLKAVIWINANAIKESAVVWSDSIYAVTGCKNWLPIWKVNGWKKIDPNPNTRRRTIPNAEIWKAIDSQLCRNHLIEIVWCKGHSGIPGNTRADELAGQARKATSTASACDFLERQSHPKQCLLRAQKAILGS